jgi:pilus assembly protein CpaE
MGSKGGVGATSVACQLGFELSRLGQDTAIVDFNLPLGDVALYYDLQPQRTIAHLTKGDLDVDLEYIEMILQNHASGLRILAAPLRVEESQVISPQHLSSALETLRSRFDWIVVDISRRWGEECVRALDMASQILVVCTLDIPTLNHTKNHLELMERLGLSDSAVRLIANRHSSKQTVTERDVIEFLGRSPDAKLSNDFPAMAAAINEGRAIHEVAPRSPLAADFRTLTSLIHDWCGIEYPANQKRRGFWGALRRPKEGS